MNLYNELRDRQQKEYNAFPVAFAFSNEQFDNEMIRLGLKPTDTHKVVSIGYGGFIRKSDLNDYKAMLKRHKMQRDKAIAEDKDGLGYIKDMFDYELANHEYGYTYDLEPTLDALGLTIEEINKDKKLTKGLQSALRRYKRW